jgi:cysteine-S-conjugate beta-lyase
VSNPLHQLSLEQLRRRTSIKWQRYPDDVLPLWVAEMDVTLAEPIVAAVTDAMRSGDTGYPSEGVYAAATADFARDRWGWAIDVARTRLVPDVMLGIVEVLKLITDPGDAVFINSPVYPPFYAFIEHMDRRPVEVPLRSDHRLDLSATDDAFAREAATGRRAAFLLCSPHNPTGTVHTPAELEAVAQLADAHGIGVVVDEIHAPIVPAGAEFTPYLTVPGSEHGVVLLSASKAFNLAGLKAALAVAGEAAADMLVGMPEEVGHGASHVGVIAHAAAWRGGRGWLDAVLQGLEDNRRLLAELLAEQLPVIRYRPPEGTYLAWLDCRELGLGDDPAEVFLERGRVALHGGPAFGTGGEGHARLNLATTPEILTEAVARMCKAV